MKRHWGVSIEVYSVMWTNLFDHLSSYANREWINVVWTRSTGFRSNKRYAILLEFLGDLCLKEGFCLSVIPFHFALRTFIFRDIHKKQGRSSSNSGYRIPKICGWKMYSRTRTFDVEVHKSNSLVKKLAQQVWKWWIRLKNKFCFNDLLTKSNRTEIQTYKGEERTFGTPCISCLEYLYKFDV